MTDLVFIYVVSDWCSLVILCVTGVVVILCVTGVAYSYVVRDLFFRSSDDIRMSSWCYQYHVGGLIPKLPRLVLQIDLL